MIGAALGLTGDAAPGDVPGSVAMEYEVHRVNKAGGIDGNPIKLIIKDMKSDPALGHRYAGAAGQGRPGHPRPGLPGYGRGRDPDRAKTGMTVLERLSTQPEYGVVGGTRPTSSPSVTTCRPRRPPSTP